MKNAIPFIKNYLYSTFFESRSQKHAMLSPYPPFPSIHSTNSKNSQNKSWLFIIQAAMCVCVTCHPTTPPPPPPGRGRGRPYS